MDLSSRRIRDSFTVQIKDPATGETVEGMSVNLHTTYSAQWKAARAKLAANLERKGKNYKPTQEHIEQAKIDMISSVVMSWDGFEEDGKKLSCVPSAIDHVLKEYPWLLNQLDTALGNESNFLTLESTDSD